MSLQAETLRLLRTRAGLTQAELAAKVGKEREQIAKWESRSGRHGINDANARKLALALGAPQDALTKAQVEATLVQEVRQIATGHQRRLKELEARVDRLYKQTARGFEALGHRQHGLGAPAKDQT